MIIDLNKLGLMTGAEASQKWGYNRSYVKNMFSKYPEKFLKGSVVSIGNPSKPTLVISREGMEHLTGKTEDETKKHEE